MFRHYQLRTTSGTSHGGRSHAAAGRPSSVSQWTVSNSSLGSSRGSTPLPGGTPTSSLSGPARTGSTDFSFNPPPSTQPCLKSIPHSLRAAASDTSSVDEPISAGVRRPRDTNTDDPGNDPTCLSPRRIKRLKVHAKKLADDLQIPDKSLIEFIETGDLFVMLVDMKASLVKYELSNQTNQLQALQDTLSSKDFELGLHNRLLACLLSPNLTAYVTDTQRHIMDFIFEHLDVFKIPAGVFDDAELQSSLGRTVTRLLATIRSQLKSQLTTSIAKKTCIIDVTKVLARSSSGMEVDAAHWNRMAFLRRCLRLFLIGTSDHKVAALDVCFTPRLIPNLKSDMRKKLEQELGIDISDMERTLFRDDTDVGDTTAASEGNDSRELLTQETTIDPDLRDNSLWPRPDDTLGTDADADGITDQAENPSGDADELDETDSGFGLVSGKPVRFNSSKFWNYVDYMLNLLHESVHKDATSKEDCEKAIGSIFVQIFQDDLADCPGSRRGAKILAVNPQWQTTIQQGLMW